MAGNQPPPFHKWSGLLITDIFQQGLEEWITKAVGLALGEAIPFFGQQSLKERLSLGNARDVRFSLTGLINWAGRTAQVMVTVITVQEGHRGIVDAVVVKRTNARGPGHPHRMTKVTRALNVAYNIEECMQGLKEDAPKMEVRNGNVINHRPEQRNAHSQCAG